MTLSFLLRAVSRAENTANRRRSCRNHRLCATAAHHPRVCRGALFDLDGTLLDIEPLSTDAINLHIGPLGGFCDAELKRKILGKRAAEWCRIVIGAFAGLPAAFSQSSDSERTSDECQLQGKTTPEELERVRLVCHLTAFPVC
jgi:hypothetical protein